jgi:hypothetical protein
MNQKLRMLPLVLLLVSYAAWRLQYPHLNKVNDFSGESAVCLVFFLTHLFNLIRRKLMSKEIPTGIGEEAMREYLELAISSMKNIETVR